MATLAADFAPVRRSDWTLPVAAYGAYALVCILAFHSTALQMAATWFSSSSYHHGAAVPLLAALMIVERPRFDPSTFSPALLAGEEASAALEKEIIEVVRREIGPIAKPDHVHITPALPKTRSGKIMRRILRKIAENEFSALGDTSTLADPGVVDALIEGRKNR